MSSDDWHGGQSVSNKNSSVVMIIVTKVKILVLVMEELAELDETTAVCFASAHQRRRE